MASLLRINEDIQFVLSRLLPKVKDPRVNQGGMITITGVDTTSDLRYAKVYLSVLGDLNEKEFTKGLKSASPWLRRELGSRLNLRHTPELTFTLDSSIAHGAHISELLRKLDIPEEASNDD